MSLLFLLLFLLLLFCEALKATDNQFELDSLQMDGSVSRVYSLKNLRLIWNSIRFKRPVWIQNFKWHSRCI